MGSLDIANRGGLWAGLELDEAVGVCNGSVNGQTYFTCDPRRGIFVRPSRLKELPRGTHAAAVGVAQVRKTSGSGIMVARV